MGQMMSCIQPQQLGAFFDGQLPDAQRAQVQDHLKQCPDCMRQLADLSALRDRIVEFQSGDPPPELWQSIEESLDAKEHRDSAFSVRQLVQLTVRRKLAAAASIAAAIGIIGFAAYWFGRGEPVQAAAIDFSILLDSLSDGAVEAFDQFVAHHGGRLIDPANAHRQAPRLDFEVPAELPGGWRRENTYQLDFGGTPGIAARYARADGEILATVFHPPVKTEDFGSHRDFPCVIGKHRGHSVQVGDWRMVHLTDPSTCHCVLIRDTDDDQLAGVMSAIAPRSEPVQNNDH